MDCISNHMFEFGICFNHSTRVSQSVVQILAKCCTVQILGKHFHIVRDSDSKCWKMLQVLFHMMVGLNFNPWFWILLASARFSLWGSSHLWCICYGWSRTGDCTLAKQCCTNPMQMRGSRKNAHAKVRLNVWYPKTIAFHRNQRSLCQSYMITYGPLA